MLNANNFIYCKYLYVYLEYFQIFLVLKNLTVQSYVMNYDLLLLFLRYYFFYQAVDLLIFNINEACKIVFFRKLNYFYLYNCMSKYLKHYNNKSEYFILTYSYRFYEKIIYTFTVYYKI